MQTQLDIDTVAFVGAYIAGNRAAQDHPDRGAFNIADDLGHARETPLWNAAVGGAADFLFDGAVL